MEDSRLAFEKGYRIFEICEVYEYQKTQYNPETGEGEIFVDCIYTFLKMNSEARAYPGWVHSPEDEYRNG